MKFKVGDRVRVLVKRDRVPIGSISIIDSLWNPLYVSYPYGINGEWFGESELELINDNNMELKITKEKVLEAASKCSESKRTLEVLFPEAFESEVRLEGGQIMDRCGDFPSWVLGYSSYPSEVLVSPHYEFKIIERGSSRYLRFNRKK